MAASNMYIQTTGEPSYMDRPSMKEDDHPDHNMPAPEYNGTKLNGYNPKASINDPSNYKYKKDLLEESK